MQTTAEGTHICKLDRNYFETQLVELCHLVFFLGIHTNGFRIQHKRKQREDRAQKEQALKQQALEQEQEQ